MDSFIQLSAAADHHLPMSVSVPTHDLFMIVWMSPHANPRTRGCGTVMARAQDHQSRKPKRSIQHNTLLTIVMAIIFWAIIRFPDLKKQ